MLVACKKLLAQAKTFAQQRAGNIAVTFALAAVPVIGGVGAAVDLSRANSVKSAMQVALDSTALMLAKNAASMSSDQLQTSASAYFKALFTRPEANNVSVSATYTATSGSSVVISGTANVPTTIMGIIGYRNIAVTASFTAKWGSNRLRVALVLDNTGSMADDGKMTALQTATKNLLAQLKSAVSVNGDVYVSIVPFSKDVNFSWSNYNSHWIDWSDWNDANQTCTGWGWNQTCGPANHNTWNGCVTDRGNSGAPSSGNYDTNVVAPTTSIAASLYAAEQYGSCPQAVMALSYDWTSMNTLVTNMSPNGNTNQAVGLQAGWMSLVGGGPFPTPPTMDPNYQYSQIIILLTDGLNTQDRWYTKQSSIDAREQLTCDNIKAANITLYTIQVNTGGDPTSTLLQNCASTSDKFFLLTSASQIVATFNAIGTNLTKLRVAR